MNWLALQCGEYKRCICVIWWWLFDKLFNKKKKQQEMLYLWLHVSLCDFFFLSLSVIFHPFLFLVEKKSNKRLKNRLLRSRFVFRLFFHFIHGILWHCHLVSLSSESFFFLSSFSILSFVLFFADAWKESCYKFFNMTNRRLIKI